MNINKPPAPCFLPITRVRAKFRCLKSILLQFVAFSVSTKATQPVHTAASEHFPPDISRTFPPDISQRWKMSAGNVLDPYSAHDSGVHVTLPTASTDCN